jgi:hypothetical protein
MAGNGGPPKILGPFQARRDRLCKCVPMTPDRRPAWLPWLRIAVPGAFVGYGVSLVSHSAILGLVAGLVLAVLCWVVLRPMAR